MIKYIIPAEKEIESLYASIKGLSKSLAEKDYNLRLEKIDQIKSLLDDVDDNIISFDELEFNDNYLDDTIKYYLNNYTRAYNFKKEGCVAKEKFISTYMKDLKKIKLNGNTFIVELDDYFYCHNFTKVRLIDVSKLFQFINLHLIDGLKIPYNLELLQYDNTYTIPLDVEKKINDNISFVVKDRSLFLTLIK